MKRSALMTLALAATLAVPSLGAAAETAAVEPGVPVMPVIIPVGEALPTLAPAISAVPQLPEAASLPAEAAVPAVAAAGPAAIPASALTPVRAVSRRLGLMSKMLGKMPDMAQASDSQARSSGDRVAAAMTGESLAPEGGAGAPAGDGSSSGYSTMEQVKEGQQVVEKILKEMRKVIVGQEEPIKAVVMGLVAGRHVLLEGKPGVGKTQLAKAAADAVDGVFTRVQGTNDKQPGDITGVEVAQKRRNPQTGEEEIEFVVKKGPLFGNVVLIDEINRMVPKAQSAVLETMEEYRATIGNHEFSPKTTGDFKHFTVIATQNPIEQDGTNRLPEAQLDRFMFKVLVQQPSKEDMTEIGNRYESKDKEPQADKVTNLEELARVRHIAENIRMDPVIKEYINDVAMAPSVLPEVSGHVEYTVYTRAMMRLRFAARLNALMEGRNYVTPHDVRAMAPLVLRHRIALAFNADLPGNTQQDKIEHVIKKILDTVPVPPGYGALSK